MSDGVIRVLGRDWTADDRVDLAMMLEDETVGMKDVCARFGVTLRAFRPEVRAMLGVGKKRRLHGGNNHRGRLPIPERAHPLVRRLYRIINKERSTQKEAALRAGLNYRAVHEWQKQTPSLANLEAVLNVYGYRLVIEEIDPEDRKRDAGRKR